MKFLRKLTSHACTKNLAAKCQHALCYHLQWWWFISAVSRAFLWWWLFLGRLNWHILEMWMCQLFWYIPCQDQYWMAIHVTKKTSKSFKSVMWLLTLQRWQLLLCNNFAISICTDYYRVRGFPPLLYDELLNCTNTTYNQQYSYRYYRSPLMYAQLTTYQMLLLLYAQTFSSLVCIWLHGDGLIISSLITSRLINFQLATLGDILLGEAPKIDFPEDPTHSSHPRENLICSRVMVLDGVLFFHEESSCFTIVNNSDLLCI